MRIRAFQQLLFVLVSTVALLSASLACDRTRGSSGAVSAARAGAGTGTGSTTAPPELDGSFERGGEGWTLDGTSVVEVGSGAVHGTKALVFDPGAGPLMNIAGASTRLLTQVGREYRVTFAYQAGFERGMPLLSVTVDGRSPLHVASVVRFFDPGQNRSVPQRSAWLVEQVSFFAENPVTVLAIGPFTRWHPTIGWGKVWIDDVRIEALDSHRTLGRDIDVRVTLPSSAQVGEELELTVSLSGHVRRSPDSGGTFDARPLRHECDFSLASDDPAATLPAQLAFRGQAMRSARVRFGSPGIRRLTLSTPDGFRVLSNPVEVVDAPPARRSYWGDIHVHTSAGHSDWIGGGGAPNYVFARYFADLDFAALSEHFDGGSANAWMDRLAPASEHYNQPGRFVTFLGVESFGFQGHTNHYLRASDPLAMFDPRNSLPSREAQSANLRARGVQSLSIPHHFMLLDPADWRATDREVLRLAEIYSVHGSSEEAGAWWRHPDHTGFSYSNSKGARGHDFRSALQRGHRLGVVACSDTHESQPGLSGLTCVRSAALTREALWDALYERSCYATSGARILLDFELEGVAMGGEAFLAPGTPLLAHVEVHGQAQLEALEILRDGVVVATRPLAALDHVETIDLGPYSGSPAWFYVRVRQIDQHRAWSSPIWIDPAGQANPMVENRDLGYEHGTGQLSVDVHNHGDLGADVGLRVYSSRREPSLAVLDPSNTSQPGMYLRLEPAGGTRTRVFGSLYLPRHLRRSFQFSGELQVQNAAPNSTTIVADPRGMLLTHGNGRFTWNDEVGVEYLGLDSLSGQITDFEFLIDTLPDTQVFVSPRLDAAPLGVVYVGSQNLAAASTVALPVGRIARMAPQAETTFAQLDGGTKRTATFAGLAPDATYVAVLVASGGLEHTLDDNSAFVSVPPVPPTYWHWPEYSRLAAPRFPALDDWHAEPDPCCGVGP